MKVLVIGANGKVGRIQTDKLQRSEHHEPIAGVRKEKQMKEYTNQGVETAFVDLEGSIEDIEKSMNDVDAVVFSAGAGGAGGPDKTMMVDFDGAVKAMEAAKHSGVKRFVIVSAYLSNQREHWSYNAQDIPIGNYYFASKYYADEWLKNSGLDYTIIRPTLLSDEAGRGTVVLSENLKPDSDSPEVTREDVADTIVAVLDDNHAIGKAFDISDGNQAIEKAVSNL